MNHPHYVAIVAHIQLADGRLPLLLSFLRADLLPADVVRFGWLAAEVGRFGGLAVVLAHLGQFPAALAVWRRTSPHLKCLGLLARGSRWDSAVRRRLCVVCRDDPHIAPAPSICCPLAHRRSFSIARRAVVVGLVEVLSQLLRLRAFCVRGFLIVEVAMDLCRSRSCGFRVGFSAKDSRFPHIDLSRHCGRGS